MGGPATHQYPSLHWTRITSGSPRHSGSCGALNQTNGDGMTSLDDYYSHDGKGQGTATLPSQKWDTLGKYFKIHIRPKGMMVSEDPPDVKSHIGTDTLVLAGLSPSDLEKVDSSSLGRALRRIIAQDEDSADPVVGFQASI
jgi:FXSXX-COOH protein